MARPWIGTAGCLARVTYRARGDERESWVAHAAPVSIHRAGDGEMPVALRIEWLPAAGGRASRAPSVILSRDGAPWHAPEVGRRPILEESLADLLRHHDAVAAFLHAGEPPWPRGTSPAPLPARILHDGRDAAADATRAAAGGAAIHDGALHLRCLPPSLAIVPGAGRTAQVRLSTAQWPDAYAFSPHRREALGRFVEAATSPGGFSEVDVSIRSVEHRGDEALGFPEARANARQALVSALRAMRELLPGLDAGSVLLAAEAARVREGLEAGTARAEEADAALAALDGARQRMGSPVHLRHAIRIGRAAIALSAPEPRPEDDASLSALAP